MTFIFDAAVPRARRIAIRGCLAFLFVLSVPVVATAGPWVLGPREFQSEVRGSYFSANTFLDDNGERPPLGATFEHRSLRWANELGWKKRMSFRFEIPFENQSRILGTGVQPENTRTGLSDLLVGFNVRLIDGTTALSLEADWKAPLGYNADLLNPLGNGHQEAFGALNLGITIPAIQGFVQAAGGYRAVIDSHDQPDDPNNNTLASADGGVWLGSSVLLSGAYRGQFEAEDAQSTIPASTEHLAGPQVLYRVDDFLDVFAGSLHTVSGKNVLHRDVYYVGITTHKTHYDRLRGFVGSKKRS